MSLAETEKKEQHQTSEKNNLRKPLKANSEREEGFVKLPRSLFNDPRWKSMRNKYQKVFLTLLCHTSYTQQSFSIGTNLITIAPGQFCTTIRALVDLCNDGVKFEQDRVDKNIVERSVSLFTQLGFVRQEVRQEGGHKKSIFTITFPDLYEHFKLQSETQSEPKPRHNRDTNEERKEREEIIETIEGAEALDSALINLKKEEKKKRPSIFNSDIPPPNLTDEKENHFETLWEFIKNNKIAVSMSSKQGIKEKDVRDWLGKYDYKEIFECLKLALKATIKSTYPGYVTQLLKERVPQKEAASKAGRKIVEDFIKANETMHIELKQDYFKDLISGDQSYYSLPGVTLHAILKRSLERYKEREDEERRQKDYEDEY